LEIVALIVGVASILLLALNDIACIATLCKGRRARAAFARVARQVASEHRQEVGSLKVF
jgi:hypothetical protein